MQIVPGLLILCISIATIYLTQNVGYGIILAAILTGVYWIRKLAAKKE
jgi:hypothetical protein